MFPRTVLTLSRYTTSCLQACNRYIILFPTKHITRVAHKWQVDITKRKLNIDEDIGHDAIAAPSESPFKNGKTDLDLGIPQRCGSTPQEPGTQRIFLDDLELQKNGKIQECKITCTDDKDLALKCTLLAMEKACKYMAEKDKKKKKKGKKGCGKGGKGGDDDDDKRAEMIRKCQKLARKLCKKMERKAKEAALLKECRKMAEEEMCKRIAKKDKNKSKPNKCKNKPKKTKCGKKGKKDKNQELKIKCRAYARKRCKELAEEKKCQKPKKKDC
ncbi:hypothetical protein KR026_000422 [Drosophila bipectinata]|nr:hypothetical protein KR026_000422 [Drosophila bipectinata]